MEIRDRLPREGPFRNPGESARDDNLPGGEGGEGEEGKNAREEEAEEGGWDAVGCDFLPVSMTSVSA